jgi:UDP-sugar transporter A1/2/3
VTLTVGVVLVQVSQLKHVDNSTLDGQHSHLLGVGSLVLSSVTSGFAGVYFEKVLKTGSLTLWQRNLVIKLPQINGGLY